MFNVLVIAQCSLPACVCRETGHLASYCSLHLMNTFFTPVLSALM